MRKGNVLAIAVMAFALVAFLFVLDYSINPSGKWPWSVHTAKNTNAVVSTNTSVNTNLDLNANTVSNTNTSTNTNTVSTADWKTYTNETYKYSMKYPKTYSQILTPNGNVSVRFDKGKMNTADYQFLLFYVTTSSSDTSTAENSVYQWGKEGFSFTAPITTYHQNPRRVKLGKETFVVTDGDLGSSGIPEYLLFKNNLLYSITSYSGNHSQSSNRELIETMAFPDPTADWKTYTNTEYSYSLKYPQTYVIDQSGKTGVTLASSQNCLTQKKNLPDAFDQVVEISGCSFFSSSVQGNKITMGGKVNTVTKIDGRAAEKFINEDSTQAGSVLAQVEKGGQWFILQNAFHNSVKTETLSVFDQVLSTFTFTN